MKYKGADHGIAPGFEVEIEKLVYGGEGLGRHEGKVVFVPFTAPGDRVEVRPVEHKKSYIRGVATRIVTPGPGRADPPCPHFLRCGGCQWQHLDYAVQLDAKRKILEELFHHRFPETRNSTIVMKASPAVYGYRSRARMQARRTGPQSSIGFFQYRSHTVEDVSVCPLLRPALNDALEKTRKARNEGIDGPAGDEFELVCGDDGKWAFSDAEPAKTASLSAEKVLFRRAGEFVYATAPSVFFQANDFMLGDLIAAVLDSAPGGKSALDLYAGVGFFSLPLARRYENVIAVESNTRAHQLCLRNANDAGLANIETRCADVRDWMTVVGPLSSPAFDLILLDPPRTGAEPEVMKKLTEWAPGKIVYVSCDPQTLVRDLSILPARDYRIDRIVGLDLFPQSYHFETLTILERGK